MKVRFFFIGAFLALSACAPYSASVPSGEPTVSPAPQPGAVEVAAAIVQANNALFQPGNRDLPAQVVFSLDPAVTSGKLSNLGQEIFRLKNTSPTDPAKRELALNVTDETYRPNDFRKVPASMAGSDQVYICGLVIKRALLPKGHLGPGNDYGSFLLKCRVDLRDNQPVGVEHIGISWITPR